VAILYTLIGCFLSNIFPEELKNKQRADTCSKERGINLNICNIII